MQKTGLDATGPANAGRISPWLPMGMGTYIVGKRNMYFQEVERVGTL